MLARLDRLDLVGDASNVRLTRNVLSEIHDKQDDVSIRVDKLVSLGADVVDPAASDAIDPFHTLGPGERSVLSFAVATSPSILCVLDDAAARAEARRLGLSFVGTLDLILRAKVQGKVPRAGPLARDAVDAGLSLDDRVLRRALGAVAEPWPPA